MKQCFDTNVIVAALVEEHHHHTRAFPLVNGALKRIGDACISTHVLAETFSTLTRLDIWPRIDPDSARRSLDTLRQQVELISLEPDDYDQALARVAAEGLIGGAVVYDALHAQAALKARADRLVTFNEKDFRRLGVDIAALVVVPRET